jgi:hypothetical protein
MPLSDYEKHKDLLLQCEKEINPRTRKKMENAAFKYLNQDLRKSKPWYGAIPLFICVFLLFLAVIVVGVVVNMILPATVALSLIFSAVLVLLALAVMTYRLTGHLDQDAFVSVAELLIKTVGNAITPESRADSSKTPKTIPAQISINKIEAKSADDHGRNLQTPKDVGAPKVDFDQ